VIEPTYGIAPAIVERMRVRRGGLHVFDRIAPRATALVVIDMQAAFLEPGAPAETPAARAIVPAINRLARALRERGGAVAWVQAAFTPGSWPLYFDHMVTPAIADAVLAALTEGAPGQALWHELDVQPQDLRVTKRRYSAFFPGACDLADRLRACAIDTVLIAGTLTNVCCEASARDAMMADFKTIMIADANAARSDDEHCAALGSIVQFFGDVRSTDETIAMLAAGA
jgi:ureidoacrylate peracid hydrolase